MVCTQAEDLSEGQENEFNYSFIAVVPEHDDNESENSKFFKYTPSGSLSFGCTNKHPFEEGKEYYIDITLAE